MTSKCGTGRSSLEWHITPTPLGSALLFLAPTLKLLSSFNCPLQDSRQVHVSKVSPSHFCSFPYSCFLAHPSLNAALSWAQLDAAFICLAKVTWMDSIPDVYPRQSQKPNKSTAFRIAFAIKNLIQHTLRKRLSTFSNKVAFTSGTIISFPIGRSFRSLHFQNYLINILFLPLVSRYIAFHSGFLLGLPSAKSLSFHTVAFVSAAAQPKRSAFYQASDDDFVAATHVHLICRSQKILRLNPTTLWKQIARVSGAVFQTNNQTVSSRASPSTKSSAPFLPRQTTNVHQVWPLRKTKRRNLTPCVHVQFSCAWMTRTMKEGLIHDVACTVHKTLLKEQRILHVIFVLPNTNPHKATVSFLPFHNRPGCLSIVNSFPQKKTRRLMAPTCEAGWVFHS